MNTRTGEHPSL